jgi:hypothetical protein
MATRPSTAAARPSVQIPTASDDRPSWKKVGAIAAVGFVVGVVWPRIAGVRLGPSVPDATPSATASAEPVPSAVVPTSPSSTGTATAPAPPAGAAPSAPGAASSQSATESVEVAVAHGSVSSCETAAGDVLKGGQCGGLGGLDAIVMPRLRKLARCRAPSASSGKLRFDVALDFARGSMAVDLGRGRANPSADSLLACARTEVSGASIAAIEHEHPRYTVAYWVGLNGSRTSAPAATISEPLLTPASSAESAAQVEWEVAIVRDVPKTGKVVARLQRGATVHIGTPKDGWYPVQYGDGYASAGWVYRGAIGR